LSNEIAFHIQMRKEENIRAGMEPGEALRAARLRFGSVESVRESYRDQRGLPWIETTWADARYAVRMLRKSPGFTAVAVTMLALGIGINAAVFAIANAVLFKGFPFVYRNDRILYITTSSKGVYYPDFEDWRTQAESFAGMAIVRGVPRTLSGQGDAVETYFTAEISTDAFEVLGVRPILGRDFTPADGKPGAAPVLILRHDLWEQRFGKDPAIIGQTVRLNGIPTTVIGVMPQGFAFPEGQFLWTPPMPSPEALRRDTGYARFVFGRMADGATIQSARTEMEAIGRRLASAYPRTNRGVVPVVKNFNEFFIGENATALYKALWGAVGFVLLIACANLANLLLGRAAGRSREISIRAALGAGQWRIIRQLLVESLMLSSLGGIFGWWIAGAGVRVYALSQSSLDWTTHVLGYTMDYRVFVYIVAISVGTGILFGLAPAINLAKLDVNTALKSGGGAAGGTRVKRFSALLVAAEGAIVVVLLAGAGVMIRSFLNVSTADVGVKTANILTSSLNISLEKYPTAEAWIAFYESLEARLQTLPGVESAAIAEGGPSEAVPGSRYELAGDPVADERRTVPALVVDAGYFRTLGASMISGREFNDFDRASGIPVGIVNQRFASRNWPGENPIGKRLRLFRGEPDPAKGKPRNPHDDWLTVVGVVSNIVQNDPTLQNFDPLVYLPYRQRPGPYMFVFVRTRVPPGSLGNAFRRAAQAIDSDARVSVVMPLEERLHQVSSFAFQRNMSALLLVFAAIALLLATVGLYAVVAHSVSRRTREIGVRMAMGAASSDVFQLVLRQGIPPVGAGLAIGLAASFAVNRLLKAELVQVSPNDPTALFTASALLVWSATLGCLIPARRAMRVDPAVALRHE
jgi:predicted permease